MTRKKNSRHNGDEGMLDAQVKLWVQEYQEGQNAIAEMKQPHNRKNCEGCIMPIAARNRLLCSLICGAKKKSKEARKWVEARKRA